MIVPHFHEVDQFQVFVSGSGSLGRQAAAGPLAVHYAAWSTVFVPATDPALELRAGPKGLEVMLLQYPRKLRDG